MVKLYVTWVPSFTQTIFTEKYRGPRESPITQCNNNHLQISISKSNELAVDCSASNMDVAAQKPQILKCGYSTHIFIQAAPKIGASDSRLVSLIQYPNVK